MEGIFILLLGLIAASSLLSTREAEDDDDSGSQDDEPDDTADDNGAGAVYHLDLTLTDASFNIAGFNPELDKLIVRTNSADLTFEMEEGGDVSTLHIGYGDTTTSVTCPWPDGNMDESVIIRYDGPNESLQGDYSLRLYEANDAEINDADQYAVLTTSTATVDLTAGGGIINLGGTFSEAEIKAAGPSDISELDLEGEIADFVSDKATYVIGGDGDERYSLEGGSFNLVTQDGNDKVTVSGSRVNIDAGGGDDIVSVSDETRGSSQVIVYGGAGEDMVSASDSVDFVDGGRDNDVIVGHGGDDLLVGGTGMDTLFGGAGNDVIFGSSGDLLDPKSSSHEWHVYSDGGADQLYGGAGNDEIHADQWDTVYGGAGEDIISSYFGSATISATYIADFDPTHDRVEVIIPADDPLVSSGLVTGAGPENSSLTWVAADEGSNVYILRIGDFRVLEVSSDTVPSLTCVSVQIAPVL